ncbi:MAG: RNA-binding protein [Proteobacteria bacterium]|nr:RNA-binding protein [Pseudomonadota bacterium]
MVEQNIKEQPDETVKLFIGNLSYKSLDDDIQTLLAPYGEVLAVDIARDKITRRSKGFAFVTFILNDTTELYELDGLILDQRALKINEAEKYRKVKQNKKKKRSAF